MTMTTPAPTLITASPKHAAERDWPVLTAHDTCDRCGYVDGQTVSRAYTRWAKDDLEVVLCSHHTNEHTPGLVVQGFVLVTDQRAELLVKPGASA
jgi:hypothetical protein